MALNCLERSSVDGVNEESGVGMEGTSVWISIQAKSGSGHN